MRAWRSTASTAFMLTTAAIAGCGGGGSGSVGSGGGSGGGGNPPPPPVQQPLTGVFVAGGVQGLHFRTATREGVTDAEGRFTFLPGETVAFSIGGVQLGSAAGAAQIDPFDLVGMTPPGTELALRAELTTVGDVTGFDRVANIALLLVSLDVDKDPETGIDLTGWDAALAGASLSLDVPLTLFAFERFESFKRAHGVNRSVPIELPLVLLYRALGITVVAQARGSVTVTERSGAVVTAFQYDEHGRLIRTGVSNGETRSAYDRDGRLVSAEAERFDQDGSLTSRRVTALEYDAAGKRTLASIEFRSVGTNLRTETRYTYDAAGVLLSQQFDFDRELDESIDTRDTTTHTYDAAGNEVGRLTEHDANFDDTPDSRTLTTLAYDASGNLVTETIESDDSEESFAFSRSYDSSGRLATFAAETLVSGSPRLRETMTFTYDAAGRVTSELIELDANLDDDVLDERTSTVRTYDAIGNCLSAQTERVRADDDIHEFSASLHTYGPTGALLATRNETQGVLMREDVFTLVEISAGVGYLIREHLGGQLAGD